MEPTDLRAFAGRDWAAAARAKRQYWADRYQREGAEPARHASTLLLEHARRLGLSDALRPDDFAHHLVVRDRLDRAASALGRR